MIYLDNNATTFLDPEVLASIQPFMCGVLGNPSSIHRYGQQAKALLIESHNMCAKYFKVRPDEIVFTSGATEALNFLIHCLPKKGHVITSSLEHAAVLEPLKHIDACVTYLDPEPGRGSISAKQVKEAIQPDTSLLILSAANNETGIKIDIEPLAELAFQNRIPFVLDGVALLGKEAIHLPEGVSAACFSGHKVHAPMGIGLAIIKKSFKAQPFIVGGPQQRGLRAGTENLFGILGFAKAVELLDKQGDEWAGKMAFLRDKLEEGILGNLPDVLIHGKNESRICNTSNIAFLGVDGETLLMSLDLAGLAASHGSACSSGTLATSRVLLSMGIKPHIARSSLRFSLSRFTTQEEIEKSVEIITKAVKQLRHLSVSHSMC